MGLDEKTLKNLILRANPSETLKRFKTGGSCGNEEVFRICQLLKLEGVERNDANPYLLRWFEYWKTSLVDDAGVQLYFEDVEVHADEIWDKIKYGAGTQLNIAIERARDRIRKNETIPSLDGYGGKPERLLALACYELSLIEDPFFVSERVAAEILGLNSEEGRNKAKTTMKVFIKKRIIRIVTAGNQYKATRYKFTGLPPDSLPESPENPEDTG